MSMGSTPSKIPVKISIKPKIILDENDIPNHHTEDPKIKIQIKKKEVPVPIVETESTKNSLILDDVPISNSPILENIIENDQIKSDQILSDTTNTDDGDSMSNELVNIITRTSNRPKFFFCNWESVHTQTHQKIRHLVSYDDEETHKYVKMYNNIDSYFIKRPPYEAGKFPYNLYCNELMNKVTEGWIMFLDDDDMFCYENSLEAILSYITSEDDLIMWQVQFPNRIVPSKIGSKPQLGNTSAIGFMFHSKHMEPNMWNDRQGSDYRVIDMLYKKLNPVWIEQVLTMVNYKTQRTHGSGQRQDLVQFEEEYFNKYQEFISNNIKINNMAISANSHEEDDTSEEIFDSNEENDSELEDSDSEQVNAHIKVKPFINPSVDDSSSSSNEIDDSNIVDHTASKRADVNSITTITVNTLEDIPIDIVQVDTKLVDNILTNIVLADTKPEDIIQITDTVLSDVKTIDIMPVIDTKPVDIIPVIDTVSVDTNTIIDTKPVIDNASVEIVPIIDIIPTDIKPADIIIDNVPIDTKPIDIVSIIDTTIIETKPADIISVIDTKPVDTMIIDTNKVVNNITKTNIIDNLNNENTNDVLEYSRRLIDDLCHLNKIIASHTDLLNDVKIKINTINDLIQINQSVLVKLNDLDNKIGEYNKSNVNNINSIEAKNNNKSQSLNSKNHFNDYRKNSRSRSASRSESDSEQRYRVISLRKNKRNQYDKKDKTSVNKTTVDKTTVDKTTVDKTRVDKTSVDKTIVDKTIVDKTTVDKTIVDKTIVDKTNVDKTSVNKTSVNKNKIIEDKNKNIEDKNNILLPIKETQTIPHGDKNSRFKTLKKTNGNANVNGNIVGNDNVDGANNANRNINNNTNENAENENARRNIKGNAKGNNNKPDGEKSNTTNMDQKMILPTKNAGISVEKQLASLLQKYSKSNIAMDIEPIQIINQPLAVNNSVRPINRSGINPCNELADAIYILNLTNNANNLKNKLDSIGITGITIFRKSDPKKSLIEHLDEIIIDAQQQGFKSIMVLKDNIYIRNYFMNELSIQMENLPKDWSMLYLGAGLVKTKNNTLDPEFYKSNYPDLEKQSIDDVQKHWKLTGHREGRFGSRTIIHPEIIKDISAIVISSSIYPKIIQCFGTKARGNMTLNFMALQKTEKEHSWVMQPYMFMNELNKYNKSKNICNLPLYEKIS